MGFWRNIINKLNPTQYLVARDSGEQPSNQTNSISISTAFKHIEIVNRCINLTIDNASLIDFEVGKNLGFTGSAPNFRDSRLKILLNTRPNPFMDISTFRRLSLTDFLLDGNVFWYFDGASLYHVPAEMITVIPDDRGFVHSYEYDGGAHTYYPSNMIHIRENAMSGMEGRYRGQSRLNSTLDSLISRENLLKFQTNFFDSGTAMGIIIETDQILSARMKDRQEREWMSKYNPKRSGGRPMILDGGMKAKATASANFKDLVFLDSIKESERKVAVALGVPPILLDSGNNANIKPNLELWFYTTLIPMMRKFEAAIEMFFAYDVELSTFRVPSLYPDKKAQADRLSALVNNGIMTGNEAREEMNKPIINTSEMNDIRIPANISGSATGVSGQEGGRPEETDE